MEECFNISQYKIKRIREIMSEYKKGLLPDDSLLQMVEFILKNKINNERRI